MEIYASRWRFFPFAAGFLLVLLTGFNSQAADPVNILIKSVRLIDRQGIIEDAVVNILIVDSTLEIVTKDDIAAEKAKMSVDASGTYLLGKMEMGSPSSFIILDQDPRGSLDVLLDTKSHILFAIQEGSIIVNNLPSVAARQTDEPAEEAMKSGWLAYAPPPLALPISYHDTKKWNKYEGKYISVLFNAAFLIDRNQWLSQDDANKASHGDLKEFDGGEVRGLRFGLVGTLNFETPWVYVITGATNTFDKGFDTEITDDLTWYDYRLDIPVFTNTSLSIGKQKEPISLERLTGMVFLPWQERTSMADALFPSRNVGIVMNGMAPNGWMTWAGGAFNNWIDSDVSFGDTANQFVGRLTWVPFVSDDESNLFHLGGGLRYSDAKQGMQYKTEAEVGNSPVFVDTGLLSAESALTYNLEAYWRKGPVWLGFEYTRATVDSPEDGDPSFDGYFVSASWALTGEMRSYRKRSGLFDPLPVAQSVYQGGWGAFEAAVRYSSLDLSDQSIEGGRMNTSSIGLNWWLTQVIQFSLNYRYITLDRDGMVGNTQELTTRVLLMLN
jgi:phosphate-selective porin OprO/OprP